MAKIKRRAVQIITAIGINSHFSGFINGSMYQGSLKNYCFPGLNCSSCPGALGACPLALLQTGIAATVNQQFPFFIFAFLFFVGITAGRLPCGWFCPFGLIQELIFKIPLPKLDFTENLKKLEYLKYLILLVFVVLIPALGIVGMSSTAFCRYLCPVEVLEANIPLMIVKPALISTMGFFLKWKLFFLLLILLLSIVICKPFCRFICPLGAVYSLFNSISLYRFQVDEDKCNGCARCQDKCPMNIAVYEEPNNRECMRCNECLDCPTDALTVKSYGKKRSESVEL